ncbi:MAG: LPS assembly protein LptD [Pseudomonadales bacterium]|nr:LPS assembly protein LptD [Pseudomonadales bacterium]
MGQVQTAQAQPAEQWTCRADGNGGWVCEGGPVPSVQVPVTISGRSSPAPGTSAQGSSRSTPRTGSSFPDWVPREELSQAQQDALGSNCCGAFIEPQRDDEFATTDPDQAPTIIQATANIQQLVQGITVIDGPSRIEQGYRSLQAEESVEIDQEAETINLVGNVVFREPGIVLAGSSAFVDQLNNSNTVQQASYVLHQTNVHGTASQIIYDSAGGIISIDNGEFSRCEPGDEFWLLRARELELDTEKGIGYAKAVTLRIKNIPVFYYPFTFPFPINDARVSGFLPPSLSNSDEGVDLAVPYYFNLAPQADATLTPRFIADRGAMVSGEARYLANWSMNTLSASLMPSDRLFDQDEVTIDGSESPPRERRWLAGFQHEGQIGQNLSTRIDYSKVSDEDYFRDLGNRGLNIESRTNLLQMGEVNFRTENWQLGTRVQRIQVIDPFAAAVDINKPFDRLPELRLGYKDTTGFGLQYGLEATHVSFDRDLDEDRLSQQLVDRGALVTGDRLTTTASVSLPLRTQGMFLIPTVKYRYHEWSLDDQALGTDDQPDIGVGTFSLDGGLVFERPLSLGGRQFTQTLEPRLFYLYTEEEDQSFLPTFDSSQLNFGFNQLFRDNRFSGGDRIADANQLSVAISSRLLDNQGRERGSVGIGQIFHFEDRSVSLDSPLQQWRILQPLDTERSALMAQASWQFGSAWQLRTNLQWDDDEEELDEGNFSLRYQGSPDHIINLAFRFRENVDTVLNNPPEVDPRIRQTDISAVWPLNANWRFLGRWNYDHSNSRNLESFAGLEYSNCCATIRVLAREWINQTNSLARQDSRSGVFLQLTLNGLGSLSGGGITSLLTEGIPGFEEYEQ